MPDTIIAPPTETAVTPASAAAAPVSTLPPTTLDVAAPPVPAVAAAPAPVAPVVYALALPKDSVIDATAIERTTAFAKATGLAPDIAQQTLNHANAEVAAYRDSQLAQFTTLSRETWVSDLKTDAEFGGTHYAATVKACTLAAEKFLTAADREDLNKTGWGNHPMLIKMFARVGQAMGNDGFVKGGADSAGGPKDYASILYGTPPNGSKT